MPNLSELMSSPEAFERSAMVVIETARQHPSHKNPGLRTAQELEQWLDLVICTDAEHLEACEVAVQEIAPD